MNTEKIKVIIADDHNVYRAGLRMLLITDQEIDVVAEADNGKELLFAFNEHHPDVVLTDLIIPGCDGIEAIKEMHKTGFERIIALSTIDTEHLIVEALEAGVTGYIIKQKCTRWRDH